MTDYKVKFEDLPWESPLEGLRFKAVRDGRRQMRLVEYTKDMEPHWCEKGHMGYVLEGQLEVTFAEKKVVFSRGDGLHIPTGKEHRHMAKVLSEKAVLIVHEII